MVLDPQECAEISKEMEIYRMASGTFGFDMGVHDRKTKMSGKLQVHFIAKFQCLFSICFKH